MPQQQQLTAADIRKLLNEKFPPTNPREKVYVSVTLALLESQEVTEAQLKGLAELFGLLCTALEIDPRQLLALKNAPKDEEVVGEGGSTGVAGMGGSGVGGGASAGGAGGGGAGPANPIQDATPFPAGAATSAPPGAGMRVTVGKIDPAKVPAAEAAPAAAPPKAAKVPQPAAAEEDLTPNVQSGPAVNVRPNINGSAKVNP